MAHRPLRLFLAHSFAEEKWNQFAEPDPLGVSDRELADKVTAWIKEVSHQRIEVIRTRDPFHNYVSSEVRQDISRSDAVLCLFTKRVKDGLTGLWIPSTYVISEGSAALMQCPREDETHRRLFGLVEQGVDIGHLGMAFHGDKTTPQFQRHDLDGLKSQISRIVDVILGNPNWDNLREDFEYLSIDKVVSVWRGGGVLVETRHRFRSTTEASRVEIPHKIWRVSQKLPTAAELINGSRANGAGFLRAMPIRCGTDQPNHRHCRIRPEDPTDWGFERKFCVEFTNVHIKPGQELEYEIVWGYEGAFHNREGTDSHEEAPNAVGLTTDGRGKVGAASLTLMFERDLDGEPDRTIEGMPALYTTDRLEFPAANSPDKFFHKDRSWRKWGEMAHCLERSCVLFDAYRWSSGPFHGMAKATWTPHMNYFTLEETQRQPNPSDPNSHS